MTSHYLDVIDIYDIPYGRRNGALFHGLRRHGHLMTSPSDDVMAAPVYIVHDNNASSKRYHRLQVAIVTREVYMGTRMMIV